MMFRSGDAKAQIIYFAEYATTKTACDLLAVMKYTCIPQHTHSVPRNTPERRKQAQPIDRNRYDESDIHHTVGTKNPVVFRGEVNNKIPSTDLYELLAGEILTFSINLN